MLILHLESHCFKTNQNIHDFVVAVNENFRFTSELGVSINEVSDSIEYKKQELQTLKNELKRYRMIIQKNKIEYQ